MNYRLQSSLYFVFLTAIFNSKAMKLLFFLLLLFASQFVYGQQGSVSQSTEVQNDSLVRAVGEESYRESATIETDSVASLAQYKLDSLNQALAKVKIQLDSLELLGSGPSQVYDSLQQVMQKGHVMQQLAQKQQSLAAPLAKANDLQQKFTQGALPALELPANQQLMPQLSNTTLPSLAVPGVDLLNEGIPAIPGANMPSALLQQGLSEYKLPDISKEYLPQIDSSTFSGEHIDQKLQEQLMQRKEVMGFQDQAGVGEDPLKEYLQQEGLSGDAKEIALQQAPELPIKELPLKNISEGQLPAKEQLPKLAVDHFANRKQALDKITGDVNKHKGRFSEIKSIKELPKNPFKRHPLMGVKWYKRIQPGLQWQIGVGEVFRIDIGPRLSYLVTDKLELGASYQERLSINKALPAYVSFTHDRVYGLNVFGSYEIKKGFFGQLSYERLNALMQQLPHQQDPPQDRLWVEGIRLGLGKKYTLYKRLSGYSLVEYNFSRSLHAPYRQPLQVKVGLVWSRR